MINRTVSKFGSRMRYNFPMALTTEEAAAQLGIQGRTVRLLIKQGKLPAQKFGRDWAIEEKDLDLVRERPKVGRPRKEPAREDDLRD